MKTTIITRTSKNQPLKIAIRLDDECKNGHDTWAITGTLYRAGSKVLSERQIEFCGCIHEIIQKAKKSMKQFIDLHLCDGTGAQMHAEANAYYHYQISKGIAKYHESKAEDSEKYYKVTQDHLRTTDQETETIFYVLDSINEIDLYKDMVRRLNVLRDNIYHTEQAVSHLSHTDNKDLILSMLEKVSVAKVEQEKIKFELRAKDEAGKKWLSDFIDANLRQRWQAESDAAKQRLQAIINDQTANINNQQ